MNILWLFIGFIIGIISCLIYFKFHIDLLSQRIDKLESDKKKLISFLEYYKKSLWEILKTDVSNRTRKKCYDLWENINFLLIKIKYE